MAAPFLCQAAGLASRRMAWAVSRPPRGTRERLLAWRFAVTAQGPPLRVHRRPRGIPVRQFSDVRRATQIVTPDFGAESITEGSVQEWTKNVGDFVKKDDLIAIIETDKVSVDVRATESGVLTEILVPVDGACEAGQPLATLRPGSEAPAPSASSSAPTPVAAPSPAVAAPAPPSQAAGAGPIAGPPVHIKTPDLGGESISEANVQVWNKKAGDFVSAGEVVAVLETEKVSVDVTAELSGTIMEILVEVDGACEAGQPLAVLSPGGSPPPKAEQKPGLAAEPEAPKSPSRPAPSPAPPVAAAPQRRRGGQPGSRCERRQKLSRMRLSIARSLKAAQNTTTMLTTFQEVDMSAVMAMRAALKESFEQMHGVRLGFMGVFVKACAVSLQQVPAVNAYIDDEAKEIVYRDYCDISVAVASPKGLVVPVVRNAESLTIAKVESGIGELALRARNGELSMEDMQGGTFTITNGGVFGSMLSTPIINSGFGPQSAILGMHNTKQRAVVLKNGDIVPRPVMFLALTYDHRLIDGREAVVFLATVRDLIEDPRRLILEC